MCTTKSVAEDEISFYKTIDSEITRLTKEYKVDEKVIKAIIKCESQNNSKAINSNKDSKGKIWSIDYGAMQINNYFHFDTMNNLGLDYYDEYDSLEYGIRLYSIEGLKPWGASKQCWSKLI